MIQEYLNGMYREGEEEPIYENAADNENVYENTQFSQQPKNGNGVINPALVNPSEDGEWMR